MNRLLLLLIVALLSSPVQADLVTLNVSAFTLYKSDGTDLPSGSTVVLLADLDRDGFGDLTKATNSFIADAGDEVVGIQASNDAFGAAGHSGVFTFENDRDGTTGPELAGVPLLLVWYDLAFNALNTGPGFGTDFGTYRSDVGEVGGVSWIVPLSGLNDLNFYTATPFGGPNADAAARASQETITIPEPASSLMLLLAGGLLSIRRKNNVVA